MSVPHNTRNGRLCAVTRPCRGLLLLRALDARLYFLCNPSLGQITPLPDGRMAGSAPVPGRDYASFGLGYDARARSHKVVSLLYRNGAPAGCDLYDVGAGSTGHWRPATVPPERVRMNQMGVFAQGHVHWITMTNQDEAIVSFSMAEEEFGYVPSPPGMTVSGFTLSELAGCLGLLSAPHSPLSPPKCIDIWLLTDYATGAWEKYWRIDLMTQPAAPEFMFNDVTPLALVNGGSRVVFLSAERQVAAYCLATGTLEELVPRSLEGVHTVSNVHLLAPYQESLVSAGRPFEDALFSPPPALALSMALRRLPARTLARLKLVSRSWRAMIESDRFVRWHNNTRSARTSPVSVVFVNLFGSTVPIPKEIVHPMEEPAVVSLESCSPAGAAAGHHQNLPPLYVGRVVCRKPCHGFVLLNHRNGNWHVLCNPVTQDVRGFSMPNNDDTHGCAGLGYDHSKEEHVMVRLSYTSRRCFETRQYAMAECLVWPLRDLHPRVLSCQPPVPVAVDMQPVHVGGKMYWPGEPRLGTTHAASIVAFDVCAEAFEMVPAPPVLLDVDKGDRMILTEVAGKLCAACLSANTGTMTVWGKTIAREEWTREHVIELQQWPEFSTEMMVIPMAVDPVDGRILVDTGKALGYYDTRSRTLETVYSLKTQHRDYNFIATVCEDSLLRPYNRKFRIW